MYHQQPSCVLALTVKLLIGHGQSQWFSSVHSLCVHHFPLVQNMSPIFLIDVSSLIELQSQMAISSDPAVAEGNDSEITAIHPVWSIGLKALHCALGKQ